MSTLSHPYGTSLTGRALALARTLSRVAVWAGAALTGASVLLVTYDVVVRRLFGHSLGGADELSGYAFAISVTWALAFTALERANVRIDVLYQYLPTRAAAALDWLALGSLGAFAACLAWYASDVLQTSWSANSTANTPLGTPLWIPQLLWLGGLFWFVLVLALMLLRASTALVTGDWETLRAVAGMKSAVEEAEEGAAEGERLIAAERA